MSRELTAHRVNPANDRLSIIVVDGPGPGGGSHRYLIAGFDHAPPLNINFQNGPIAEAGVNGVTHEALLTIVADRLRSFQAGPYACPENGLALMRVEEAMNLLHQRTRARMARGVEGTHAL